MKFLERILDSEPFRPFVGKLPSVKQTAFSLFGAVLLLYLFVVLLSYNPADPAWSHVGNHSEVTNLGGLVGAWIADILRAFFGLASWFLVLFLAYEMVRLWWQKAVVIWPVRVLSYVMLLVTLSGLMAYATMLSYPESAVKVGGMVGFALQDAMSKLFGSTITMLFLLFMAIVLAALTFEIRWKALLLGLFGWIGQSPEQQTTNAADMPDEKHSDDGLHEPKTDDFTPHNHDGAFASFLVHSGLRDEVLAEQERQNQAKTAVKITGVADEMPARTVAVQPAVAIDESVMVDEPIEHRAMSATVVDLPDSQPSVQFDTHANWQDDEFDKSDDVSFDEQSVQPSRFAITDTPVSFDEPAASDVQADDWQDDDFDEIDEPSEVFSSMPVQQVAKQRLDEFDEDRSVSRSRAMDTLSYRMSLSPIPELSLLDPSDPSSKPSYTRSQLEQMSELLEIKLQEFNIKGKVVSAMVGPVVTRFEVDLAPGVKASRVSRVSQDLARVMRKISLRVVEVIDGKPYIGIEVPNDQREMVRLIDLLDTPDYKDTDKSIAIAVGKDISGKPIIADLAKAPHMLVAGTTGSGKSVLVNSFLLSMLLNHTADELKLVLIDPKQLELANYGDIPHLLTPVITDMNDAVAALNWCVVEMERRYQLMSKTGVRKLSEFNKKIEQAEQRGEPIYDPLWKASDSVSQSSPPKLKPLPLIVIVADEFADMIMQLGKTAEDPIVRLAQKARAAGIHLLLATQRPTVNVVTGLIKANIPSRVALRVNSKLDSRTIIENGGAEDMLGNGDMMFVAPGKNFAERVHGAYVDDDEVNRICDAWRERGRPDYIDLSDSYGFEGEGSGDGAVATGSGQDNLYEQAVALILETRKTSTSFVQRRLGIGYPRAARLMEQMEEGGILSAADNSGKRKLLM